MRERRKQRSEDPSQALRLLLAHLAEEWDLRAAVLSDADGLVVEGATRGAPGVDLDALAALRKGQGVHAAALSYEGVTLYLVAMGQAIADRERARAAVGRILELKAA